MTTGPQRQTLVRDPKVITEKPLTIVAAGNGIAGVIPLLYEREFQKTENKSTNLVLNLEFTIFSSAVASGAVLQLQSILKGLHPPV